MDIKEVDFQKVVDNRGNLVIAEFGKQIPYEVKRVYYIYGAEENTRRGYHSHKELQQIYIAIAGQCSVDLTDGEEKRTVTLNDPSKGLYIGHGVWREIYNFSKDAVLLVLASATYSEDDYIRTYEEFIEYQNQSKQ